VAVIVGQGAYRYSVDKNWGRGPKGLAAFGVVSGVAADSKDRVYVFNRSPDPRVIVLSPEGTFLNEWGRGAFKHPHGIWISPRDEIYLTDRDTHLVTKWTLDGQFIKSWGTRDTPGAPGAPFNQPTHAVETEDGDLYVSDGYGQFRCHRFSRSGKLIRSWGEKGSGPSQFLLPHDVWVDRAGRVLVCDRENGRVQHFNRAGDYVGEWACSKNPMQIFIRDEVLYLCETFQQISVRDLDFKVISSWGSKGPADDQFTDSPHAIWVDTQGSIYVSEVVVENKVQKFTRVP
jgi:DNA-binding beta-propeller fold protein YncE